MKALIAALVLLPSLAFGQADALRVSLDARGEDVREVLATLFAQAHKTYALDASIKGKLYVKLDAVPYEKALEIVLAQSGLVAKSKDGILIVSPVPTPAPVAKPATAPVVKKPVAAPPAITPATFARKVTTRLNRKPLADVFAAFGEQAKVKIELDPSVPAYKIDAFFVKTSLKYALDRVCKAAGLRYAVEGEKIKIKIVSRAS